MMKIKIVFVCFTLLISFLSCNKKIDDRKENVDNDLVQEYIDLVSNDTLDVSKRIRYNDKALSLIDLRANDSIMKHHLYLISFYYYNLHDFNKLYATSKQLLNHSLKVNDKKNLVNSYRLLGMYYMCKSNNQKALKYLLKAKKIAQLNNDTKSLLSILEIIAMTQSYACDFLGSNKTVFEILNIQKKENINKHSNFCYTLIAGNLSLLKLDDEAIKYFKKAQEISLDNIKKSRLNNNIATSYIALKDYEKALHYINLNLENKRLLTFEPTTFAISNSIKGLIKVKKNDFKELPDIFLFAEKIFDKANSLSGRNYNQKYLSIYYEKAKDTLNSVVYAKEAVRLSKSYNNPDDVLSCLEQLIKVDKKNASRYAQEYIHINDSLMIAQRQFQDQYARIVYETDEITQQKNKAVQQKWKIAGLASLLLLIMVLFFIINYLQTKQKRILLLKDQQKANEQIYDLMLNQKEKEDKVREVEKERIALELHDNIMNKLASTRMNLSILSHKSDRETIDKCINYVNDIYKIEQEIRSVSHELNQEVFSKEDSFIKLLEDFITDQNINKAHYELELDPEINWNNISSKLKMHLYRIIQEASNNINKHAQADRAIITLALDEPNICLSITDDGIGLGNKSTQKGIGIQNMKLRVKDLRGKMNFSSRNHSGTTINISIPIRKKIS